MGDSIERSMGVYVLGGQLCVAVWVSAALVLVILEGSLLPS